MKLEDRILEHLARRSRRPLTREELARGVDRDAGDQELGSTLDRLIATGRVYQAKNRRFALPEHLNLVVGRIDMTRRGAGFVVPRTKTDAPDLFVPAHHLAGATHGDLVVARIEERRGRENPQGRVVRVLERARTSIVGTLRRDRRVGTVIPDNPRLAFEVLVAKEDMGEAKDGDKVVVAIDDWGDGATGPTGRVVEVLGAPDAPGVDILSIVRTHGLDAAFPVEVEKRAAYLALDADRDLRGRLDLRDRVAFTIDPPDAKDHDDALSVRRLEGDRLEVGVHIADVSHYVQPGGPIDEEASARGTSVYLVDRTIPMLPEHLSSDLCSLLPDQDRLTYSVILTMDGDAKVLDYQIRETVIRSRHRLSYSAAQALIQSEAERQEHKELLWEIQILRRLAKTLRRRRAERGSLDFDLPEAIVELDEDGFPIDIRESVRLDSMRLIEEFMLLANQTVARHAAGLGVPFLYRIHDRPTPEALERVRGFLAALGYELPAGPVAPRDFAQVLEQARGKPEEDLLNTVVLRSMKRARYSADNHGHFGLAAEHYTHFTSPIRRYPDLVVHRLLKRMADGERWKDSEKRERLEERLAGIAEHASARERVAAEAERDSVDLKKVEFMERHLGEEFDGKISGVTSFGMFVRLDRYFVEGLVHMHELDDDYYEFHEDKYALMGRHTGRRFRLADPLRVRVAGVDKERRQIDFELVRPEAEEKAGKRRGRSRAAR